MKKSLEGVIAKVDGLYCIVISDRDGVPIIKATSGKTPDSILKPSFLSTFASHKNSKFGLGTTESIVCFYSSYQIIQTGYESYIITFIANEDANTGLILNMHHEITPLLSETKFCLEP